MSGPSLPQTTIQLAIIALGAAVTSLWLMTGPAGPAPATLMPQTFADARGADDWSRATRERFFEDTANQWPLTDAQTRTRDGRSPLAWLPPRDQCRYTSLFVDLMQRYGLDSDRSEMQKLRTQRQRCYTQFQ